MNKEDFNFTHAADRSTSRVINQKALVELIDRSDGISKTELANELGLSKSAVSRNLADLISFGIVEEKGEAEADRNGGRKPVMLCINKSHRYIGVLDISLEEPACAIGDLSYNILKIQNVSISRESSAENKKRHVAQIFKEMLQQLSIPPEKLGVIVISQPCAIGPDNKMFFIPTYYDKWTDIGIVDYLVQEFQVPVILKNDLQLASIGEMNLGLGKSLQSLIYVSCGIGLGSGIIINGKLYEGRYNQVDGEIGVFLHSDGRQMEDVVAMEGLLKRIFQIYEENGQKVENLTFDEVVEKSKAGDPLVNQGIAEIGRILGQLIHNCSIFLDIPTIIFGGLYLKLGVPLFDSMKECIAHLNLPIQIEILPSSLKEEPCIFGGLVVGKDEILSEELRKLN